MRREPDDSTRVLPRAGFPWAVIVTSILVVAVPLALARRGGRRRGGSEDGRTARDA